MKLDMVGIVVQDMKQSLLFYERLGFELSSEFSDDYNELQNDGVRISLNSENMVAGVYGYPPITTGDRIELAFLCDTPQDVDNAIEHMKSHDYEIFKEPWDAFWGQRYAIIKDPDNNLLSLFAQL